MRHSMRARNESRIGRDRQAIIGWVLIGLALMLAGALVGASSGCASWQSTARTTLDAVGRTAAFAEQASHRACDTVLRQCVRQRLNPCDPLQRCHGAEREVTRAAVATHAAVLAGRAAVDVADKPGVALAVQRALALLEPLRTALEAYGVQLPEVPR